MLNQLNIIIICGTQFYCKRIRDEWSLTQVAKCINSGFPSVFGAPLHIMHCLVR